MGFNTPNSTPLMDSRSTLVNAASQGRLQQTTQSSRGVKRKRGSQRTHGTKRAQVAPVISTPPHSCGIGPPKTPVNVTTPSRLSWLSSTVQQCTRTLVPTMVYRTSPLVEIPSCESATKAAPAVSSPTTHNVDKSSATDVWYFLRPLDTDKKPAVLPDAESEPRLWNKPSSAFVGCKLCKESWKTFRLADSMTSCIRRHLKSVHDVTWENAVAELRLKGAKEKGKGKEIASGRAGGCSKFEP
ncbi:hypothetical protein BDQ17DRAFT_1417801 [Cyathus striatus]|nr:hypothetical protein BDQ17DRAFT_1417801 [Cyathus striatus]